MPSLNDRPRSAILALWAEGARLLAGLREGRGIPSGREALGSWLAGIKKLEGEPLAASDAATVRDGLAFLAGVVASTEVLAEGVHFHIAGLVGCLQGMARNYKTPDATVADAVFSRFLRAARHEDRLLGLGQSIALSDVRSRARLSELDAFECVARMLEEGVVAPQDLGSDGFTFQPEELDYRLSELALAQGPTPSTTPDADALPLAAPAPVEARQPEASHKAGSRLDDALPKMPRVFISYCHEDPAHDAAVLALAQQLRSEGVEAVIDAYTPQPTEGWPRWMQNQFEQADVVLLVCTPKYKRRYEGKEKQGIGLGANWEGHIATLHHYSSGANHEKFVPVMLDGGSPDSIPTTLRGATYQWYPSGYDSLYRLLTKQPKVVPAPIGSIRKLEPEPASPVATPATAVPTGDEIQVRLLALPSYHSRSEEVAVVAQLVNPAPTGVTLEWVRLKVEDKTFDPMPNQPGWSAGGYKCFPFLLRLEPSDARVGAWRFDLRDSGVQMHERTSAHLSVKPVGRPPTEGEMEILRSNPSGATAPPPREAPRPSGPGGETGEARNEILNACYDAYQSAPSPWVPWDQADAGPAKHLLRDRAARELEADGLIEVKFLQRVAFAAKLTNAGRIEVERGRTGV